MKKNDKESQSDSNASEISEKTTNKRRKFLAGITTGAAAGMVSNGNWVKPVVDSVLLPTHAQTSGGVMQLEGRVGYQGDADEFNPIEYGNTGKIFTDGTYPITSDGTNFNNFNPTFSALFEPVQSQSVSVNLDVTADLAGTGDLGIDGSLSQTASANVPVDSSMRANFQEIGVDGDGLSSDSVVTVKGTINAEGYGTRRITYIITPS